VKKHGTEKVEARGAQTEKRLRKTKRERKKKPKKNAGEKGGVGEKRRGGNQGIRHKGLGVC